MIDKEFHTKAPSSLQRAWLTGADEVALWLRSNDGDQVAVPSSQLSAFRELVVKAEKLARTDQQKRGTP